MVIGSFGWNQVRDSCEDHRSADLSHLLTAAFWILGMLPGTSNNGCYLMQRYITRYSPLLSMISTSAHASACAAHQDGMACPAAKRPLQVLHTHGNVPGAGGACHLVEYSIPLHSVETVFQNWFRKPCIFGNGGVLITNCTN